MKSSGVDGLEFPKGQLDLYLVEIGEPADNVLRIVVVEAEEDGPVDITEMGEAQRLMPTAFSVAWELTWSDYVAYAIRNESFARLEDGEADADDSFRICTQSAFLAYVAASTFAATEEPGPLVHWRLDALNHVLDVAAADPPLVRAIAPAEMAREPTNLNWVRK
jgi:hypothetical protein